MAEASRGSESEGHEEKDTRKCTKRDEKARWSRQGINSRGVKRHMGARGSKPW